MWKKLKEWAWVIILALVGMLALGQKPRWIKEKEKEIKERDKEIEQVKENAADSLEDYEGVKADHDEAIKKAQEGEGTNPFDNPDDAAKFLDDILRKRK
jgi:hypothetical protein